ncbi:MAG: agmatine deiminase family protein, partial [Aeromicrobium sp.]
MTTGWRMPIESAPHDCTWMAWPSSGYTLGETSTDADEARRTWAEVAHAVAEFEPVRMVVDPTAVQVARQWLGSDVELLEAPLDDAWMRDIGPTFVVDGGRLGAVDWVFNGWGAQEWASWEHDATIGRRVAEWAGATLVPSEL